jgi:threonine dehydrogenase-like Zn-dependent dehydrogenase
VDLPHKRLVAVQNGTGTIRAVEQALPGLKDGAVLVRVRASLVSPGTEVGGWRAFAAQRQNPAPHQDRPFGYSNAGVVVAPGAGVTEYRPGDRVACIGAGYALHSDYALVPRRLCAPLPENVSFEQGAYAMLLATAMQALRRGQPELGETVCVAGLGLVGLLTARLYQLAGNYVLGWDTNPARVAIARRWGVEAVREDEAGPAAARDFTRGEGFDAAVLAMAGPCDATLDRLVGCMKRAPDGHPMGRIMVVGWPEFKFGPSSQIGAMNNVDIRRCSRTGPGYHDEAWEYGPDYPPVFMRWTTRTNLLLCLRLVAEGKIDVAALTTHRIRLADAESEIARALDDPDGMLGVVFLPD